MLVQEHVQSVAVLHTHRPARFVVPDLHPVKIELGHFHVVVGRLAEIVDHHGDADVGLDPEGAVAAVLLLHVDPVGLDVPPVRSPRHDRRRKVTACRIAGVCGRCLLGREADD